MFWLCVFGYCISAKGLHPVSVFLTHHLRYVSFPNVLFSHCASQSGVRNDGNVFYYYQMGVPPYVFDVPKSRAVHYRVTFAALPNVFHCNFRAIESVMRSRFHRVLSVSITTSFSPLEFCHKYYRDVAQMVLSMTFDNCFYFLCNTSSGCFLTYAYCRWVLSKAPMQGILDQNPKH